MSCSNCCFLTCIQISQVGGKVLLYPHLFKNVPQFIVIHTVKVFSIVNEAEVNVFLEFSWFLYDPMDVGNLISGFLPFLNPAWTSGSSWFTYVKPSWENFEHYFASMWDHCNCAVVSIFLGIAFLWYWNENWCFSVLWPLLSFPNLPAYWVQHFHSITF